MKQIQFAFSAEYIAESLCNHSHITQEIVNYFFLRFDPTIERSETKKEEKQESKIIDELENVENLGEDRIIRHYLSVIKGTILCESATDPR